MTVAPVAVPGVVATREALAAIADLVAERGPVLFFQSGGCCDGSLPMCFDEGELIIGDHDVLLGAVGGCPFYIDGRQYEVWKHTQLILDVGDGDPEGFSLAAGENKHFTIRSRTFGASGTAGRDDQIIRDRPVQMQSAPEARSPS